MKKTVIFLCIIIVAFLAGIQSAWYVKSVVSDSVAESEPQEEKVIDDGTVSLTITAAGDCTFGTDINSAGSGSFDSKVQELARDYTYFLKLVKPIFEEDDLTIVNFEGTLSLGGARADKEFAFRGNPEYVNILTSSSVEAVNLANNHTRDYGEVAFADTKSAMTENGILWFEGKNYALTEINGITVGLIGSKPMTGDLTAEFSRNLEELKAHNPDLIIASFHWGVESSALPTDLQKKLAHTAIDNGADLIIGHHPHVLQGIEKYKGKYILYSLGNFCFGGNRNPSDKDTMIFKQTFRFNKDKKLLLEDNVSVIPCSISSDAERNNYQPMPLAGEEFERVKEKIMQRSLDFIGIQNIEFIQK